MLARLSATDRFALIQGARDYSPTLMAILSWGSSPASR
ncbi:putative branched-chain amino acid permease [Burkholderia cepacia]|nr:putative branched-chain amino acid permease [Burkholderia cepacia]